VTDRSPADRVPTGIPSAAADEVDTGQGTGADLARSILTAWRRCVPYPSVLTRAAQTR